MQAFEGANSGYVFRTGEFGLGYYTDIAADAAPSADSKAADVQTANAAPQRPSDRSGAPCYESRVKDAETSRPSESHSGQACNLSALPESTCIIAEVLDNSDAGALCQQQSALADPACRPTEQHDKADKQASSEPAAQSALGSTLVKSTCAAASAEAPCREKEDGQNGQDGQAQAGAEAPPQEAYGASQRPRHYWGQALQYLEKSADITRGAPPLLPLCHAHHLVQSPATVTCVQRHLQGTAHEPDRETFMSSAAVTVIPETVKPEASGAASRAEDDPAGEAGGAPDPVQAARWRGRLGGPRALAD